MIKQILIITFILIIVFIVIKCYLEFNYKLILKKNIIKYKISRDDLSYLKRNSTDSTLDDLAPGDIFYTEQRWSSKYNNYFLFEENYYIVEPGYYYYYYVPGTLIINQNIKIKLIKNKKIGK